MRSETTTHREKDARQTIIDLLRSRNKKARFMSEIYATLARVHIARDEADSAFRQLEIEGAVMIRDNFCADPHLAGVDLRVAALIDSTDADSQLNAIRAMDEAWNKWLSEYLANHRCG